jgi:hypothetical protein
MHYQVRQTPTASHQNYHLHEARQMGQELNMGAMGLSMKDWNTMDGWAHTKD